MKRNSRVLAAGVMLAVLAAAGSGGAALAAERLDLKDDPDDRRVFHVASTLKVEGKLYTQPGADRAIALAVDARFAYDERRQPGGGRDALALRAVRHYDRAAATIEAGEQRSNTELRGGLRLMVARGQPDGFELYSPSGPLTFDELELLRTPGDSFALAALLPEERLEPGESWTPADWVLAFLTGIEAAEKSQLKCQLEQADAGNARVRFQGEITGAALGAPAVVRVEGRLDYDLQERFIRRVELTQTEKRSIGFVSPGLDVRATVAAERTVVPRPRRLTDGDLTDLPLEPNDASRLVMFDAPAWNVRFYHDRRWHLFHQSGELAVLRLLEKGQPIAQCNIRRLADAEPGEHVAEEQFREDVVRTLGRNFQELIEAQSLKVREGLYVYRVVAVGAVERQNEKQELVSSPMQWIHYLVAHLDGRQLAFTFTVDPKLAETLASRDLSIIGGLEFLAPPETPPPAARGK